MSRQIGKIERKSRNGSIGSFFFGTFIGLLLGIGAIIGIVAFAYFKVTPNWINDKFNTEIDLGNDDLNSLTLNTFVTHAVNLGKNIDTYTLNDLQSDFGIKIDDEIAGINIIDLKNVPLPEMMQAVQNKIANISADELKNAIDLSALDEILNDTNTYYFNMSDGKLYEEQGYLNQVNFDYTIDSSNLKVIIKGNEFTITTGQVEVALRYIPLSEAVSQFASNIDSNITLGELRDEYNVTLPSFFDKVDDSTPIAELEEEINKLYIADFLNYTIVGDIVYDEFDQEVVGIMATIAKTTITDFASLESTIDNLTIAEVLGYTYNDLEESYYDKDETKVEGVMNAIAGFTISGLSDGIDTLTISDLFAPEDLNSGVLYLIDRNTTISNLPNALSTALESSTIDELISANIVDSPDKYYSQSGGTIDDGTGINNKYINVGSVESPEYKQVKNLVLNEIINVFFELIDNSGGLLDEVPSN